MKNPLLALCFALLSTSASAAEWKSTFNADAEVEGLYWSDKTVGPDGKQMRGILSLKPAYSLRRGRSFRVKLMPSAQWDPSNPSSDERFFWNLPEAYVQWQNLPYTLQAGFNTFTWGDTDVFNPLDVVSARRYFDPFRSEKLGALAVVAKRDFENFFVEAIYIPKQRETLLPGENSRWMPRDIFRVRSISGSGNREARLILPSNLRYSYFPSEELEDALDNNLGLRFKFRFPGFDWTIAAFQGASVSPDVRIRRVRLVPVAATAGLTSATFSVDPDVGLRASFYPVRMTGTSFTWVLGDFLVKGAGAYTHVRHRNFDLPARVWESVLGLERTFSVGKGSLTALAQGTYVDRNDGLDTSSTSLARMFDRGLMGALRWAPNEAWAATISYLRDTKYEGSLWHSEATYKITDGWRAKASVDLLDGPTETPLGTYKRNDRATVSLLAQF